MVALNAAHPLAQADEVRLSDLNGSPFVIFSKDEAPGFRDLMLHICRSAGFMPSKIQEAYQFLTMTCLVAAGFGVALVPESVQRLRLDKIVYKPILDATPLVELYAVWPSEKYELLVDELLAVVDDVRLVSSLARAAEP